MFYAVAFFCFDLPNFVLAGRFHAVHTDRCSAIDMYNFVILYRIVAKNSDSFKKGIDL